MKKIFMILLCMFLLVGCSSSSEDNSSNSETNKENNYSTESDVEETSNELKNPVLEWCQLYNPNGYDTVTCVISNPNKEDIDISYDLVFYKDDKEVSRIEYMSNSQVSSNHNDVIWVNVDVPSSEDATDVKMENITVTKAYYNSIDSEVKYTETIEDKAYFSVKSDKKPTLNTIYIFEYNDDNNNKKCDKGELVVVNMQSVMEKETKISIDTDVYEHNAYEVYYNAY